MFMINCEKRSRWLAMVMAMLK